jgi:hypothetical protein
MWQKPSKHLAARFRLDGFLFIGHVDRTLSQQHYNTARIGMRTKRRDSDLVSLATQASADRILHRPILHGIWENPHGACDDPYSMLTSCHARLLAHTTYIQISGAEHRYSKRRIQPSELDASRFRFKLAVDRYCFDIHTRNFHFALLFTNKSKTPHCTSVLDGVHDNCFTSYHVLAYPLVMYGLDVRNAWTQDSSHFSHKYSRRVRDSIDWLWFSDCSAFGALLWQYFMFFTFYSRSKRNGSRAESLNRHK